MKRLLILIPILIISLLTGCSNDKSKINEAKSVAENYLKTLYRIEDYNKIVDFDDTVKTAYKIQEDLKPFVTESMYNELEYNRIITLPPQLAIMYKGNIEVSNIVYESESINKDSGVVTLNCTITTKLKASDGTEIKSYDNKSKIQLKEEAGKYKVHSDSNARWIFNLIM